MRIRVQKFGGTSLSTPEARKHVLEHIQAARSEDCQLVVVVSAMGRQGEPYATDTLLGLIRQNGDQLPARERDLLMCCGEWISAANLCSLIQAEGIPAVVMTGGQAGIETNDAYGNAQIVSVQPKRILEHLDRGEVVIVAGFQGQTADHEFTTLGRGGSDTSATAIGGALKAEVVDIFTDVNGILTADPRIVEDARPLTRVSYAEICNMAHNGAKVIHPRAVEVAMQANVPVRVRSTFSKEEGTLVTNPDSLYGAEKRVEDRHVTGIAHFGNITQIQVPAAEGQYDLQLQVFKTMAQHSISVDFINVNPSGVVYTVFDHVAEKALELLRGLGYKPTSLSGCAKVSVIGGGMNGVPGVMAKIVEALTEENIRILQSADSNTTIWCLVHGEDMVSAVRALHKSFQLHK
ncbi:MULTISPECIES: aspartate kinase [unclassified Paenibacillus]|uniref:aspartate kinase n=1 Tax=unclassified Paenibacillus TaxID=185978 RepID=UPI00020D7DCA|nr:MULTISPECIES: aspartate kinase [unclassified Paenibacillus]EGL16641.1 aspartate kinase, monofunctional class [Paenibacillus sp. HGF7]EPD92013.1 aspartate kinase, monofunctional class [Paenibacillus sp. HGH0039]